MFLPIRQVDKLFHWGSLNPKKVGEHGASFEGNCLSASLCPDAWLGIARLGNNPLHAMTGSRGVFIDINALKDDVRFTAQKNYILADMIATGFLKKSMVYKAWSTDEEGEPTWAVYTTRREAECEVGCDDDEETTVEEVEQLVGTQLLIDHLGIHPQGALNSGEEQGLISWLRKQTMTGAPIDGIFIDWPFDPLGYLAPVFAVFPDRVPRWNFSPATLDIDDEELLETMPDMVVVNIKVKNHNLNMTVGL